MAIQSELIKKEIEELPVEMQEKVWPLYLWDSKEVKIVFIDTSAWLALINKSDEFLRWRQNWWKL